MFRTILKTCKCENLIIPDDFVFLGLSGGADSVCLLLLLIELQKEIDFTIQAVHVEHGIRGAESEADAAFVEELCKKHCVPLQVFHVNAIEYAKEKRLGLEEAARILRYDCYRQATDGLIKDRDVVKLALAHHADDNAETVLFQMIRGSGIDGLAGMQYKRRLDTRIEVIRPLLSVTRAQIEKHLEMAGQTYCIDSTNTDTVYSRNKMRQQVLPLLMEINTQAVSHINQSAAYLRELGSYLQGQVELAAEQVLCEEEQGILIKKETLSQYPHIIQSELLHLALVRTAGVAKDISASHVQSIAGLLDLQVGRSISLPYDMLAKRRYEGVMLCKSKGEQQSGVEMYNNKKELQEEIYFSIGKEELFLDGTHIIAIGDTKISFQLQDRQLLDRIEETALISKNTYTKCFDYDKIKSSLQIRTRKEGDYLIIDEALHRKRLKEYFINEKIPADQRGNILLLTEGTKVLWVIGGRMSADVKISNQTTKILKVQITGGSYREG